MVTVRAVYESGAIRITEPAIVDGFKAKLAPGELLAVTFRKWSDDRSLQQNRFFHALVGRFAAAHGEAAAKAKLDFKHAHGIWVTPAEAEKDPPDWPGAMHRYDGKVLYFKSTAAYSVSEMTGLIQSVIAECYDAQVDVEDVIGEYR